MKMKHVLNVEMVVLLANLQINVQSVQNLNCSSTAANVWQSARNMYLEKYASLMDALMQPTKAMRNSATLVEVDVPPVNLTRSVLHARIPMSSSSTELALVPPAVPPSGIYSTARSAWKSAPLAPGPPWMRRRAFQCARPSSLLVNARTHPILMTRRRQSASPGSPWTTATASLVTKSFVLFAASPSS